MGNILLKTSQIQYFQNSRDLYEYIKKESLLLYEGNFMAFNDFDNFMNVTIHFEKESKLRILLSTII